MSTGVLLVEDQALVRASLKSLLNSTEKFSVMAVESVPQALDALASAQQFDLVLCDYQLQGDTAESLLRAMYRWPGLPVVLLTSQANAMSLQRCRDLGASGFLFKESGIEEFIEALDAVVAGHECFNAPGLPTTADNLERQGRFESVSLTETELTVLKWLATGMSNKQIALATGKSAETIKSHVASVLRKLRCKTRTQAATKAGLYQLL